MSVTSLSTSCAMSLSPVDINTCIPSFFALKANVPITSSASTPAIDINGMPIALIAL